MLVPVDPPVGHPVSLDGQLTLALSEATTPIFTSSPVGPGTPVPGGTPRPDGPNFGNFELLPSLAGSGGGVGGRPGPRVVARPRRVAPARRLHRVALSAEHVLRCLLQDERHADGDEECVEGTLVHPLDDRGLEDEAEQPGEEERHRDGEHDGDAGAGDDLLGGVRGVGAGHEELAVRHVDHAHLAERERQAERCQQEDGAGRGAGEKGGGECVHASAS